MLRSRAVAALVSSSLVFACSSTTTAPQTADGGKGSPIYIDLTDLSDACTTAADCSSGLMKDECGGNCACVLKAFAKSEHAEASARFSNAALACQDGRYPTSQCPTTTVAVGLLCEAGHCRFADVKTNKLLSDQTVRCD
ncbi:MAG: hypothetical protein JWO86_2799 [Myxococcaceae bacterium]|jgi:hypothetical protein|nr:hypothetical protein [Myxococcaceae bacterium]